MDLTTPKGKRQLGHVGISGEFIELSICGRRILGANSLAQGQLHEAARLFFISGCGKRAESSLTS
jgi:hypothetical protein